MPDPDRFAPLAAPTAQPGIVSAGATGAGRVLLVDDEPRNLRLLADLLQARGYTAVCAADGAQALALAFADPPDLLLLDVMMPGIDGLEVCRRIRKKFEIPVIMLTAKGDETDRIVGLELGADDYLPKPFNPRELLARLRAVLRRARPDAENERLQAGPIGIEISARAVTLEGNAVDLTGIEFDILVALARRAGRVIPRERLLEAAGRGDVAVSERTIDVHISHLRQKLGDARLIKTVRGVGYVLAKEPP